MSADLAKVLPSLNVLLFGFFLAALYPVYVWVFEQERMPVFLGTLQLEIPRRLVEEEDMDLTVGRVVTCRPEKGLFVLG
jgi:hypothetical protein